MEKGVMEMIYMKSNTDFICRCAVCGRGKNDLTVEGFFIPISLDDKLFVCNGLCHNLYHSINRTLHEFADNFIKKIESNSHGNQPPTFEFVKMETKEIRELIFSCVKDIRRRILKIFQFAENNYLLILIDRVFMVYFTLKKFLQIIQTKESKS